jgi:hypothetical protein
LKYEITSKYALGFRASGFVYQVTRLLRFDGFIPAKVFLTGIAASPDFLGCLRLGFDSSQK